MDYTNLNVNKKLNIDSNLLPSERKRTSNKFEEYIPLTIYKKVVHNWGGIYYFCNEKEISSVQYEMETK